VSAAVGDAPSVHVVVLDGYEFDVTMQRHIHERAPLTVVDDLRLPTDCDLAVNPSPGGDEMRPDGAAAFLGGAAYALLRGSLLEARDLVRTRGRPQRSVLVSTGATDLDGLGERVSRELLSRDATVDVTRVVGPDTHVDTEPGDPREHMLDRAGRSGGCFRGCHRIRWCRRHDRGAGRVCRHSIGAHRRGIQSDGPGSRACRSRVRSCHRRW